MATCYAYEDRFGIVHGTKTKATAEKYAVGNVVEYEGEADLGYVIIDNLQVFKNYDGEILITDYKGKSRGGQRSLANAPESTRRKVNEFFKGLAL